MFYNKKDRDALMVLKLSFLGGCVALLVLSMLIIGWVMNLYKVVNVCDFEGPNFKCEVVRTIGVFAPPIGGVAGWVNIQD